MRDVLLAKLPVPPGGQTSDEAAPSVMGEGHVEERAVQLPPDPTHLATELFMNPKFVLDSGDIVVNIEDMKPATDKLTVEWGRQIIKKYISK